MVARTRLVCIIVFTVSVYSRAGACITSNIELLLLYTCSMTIIIIIMITIEPTHLLYQAFASSTREY